MLRITISMEIANCCALVTGPGSGLGRATVLELAKNGAKLALLTSNRGATETTALEAKRAGCASAIIVDIDLNDPITVENAFDQILDAYKTVHVCVNAAAINTAGRTVKNGESLPLSSFQSLLDINLSGTFDISRHCAKMMIGNTPSDDNERGVIINVSSGSAWQGQAGQVAYSASKAGVMGMTLPLARDLAEYGIRVVTIEPGLFETSMSNDLPKKVRQSLEKRILFPKRTGSPEEFARLVCHVLTNRYINATTLAIDAGFRMS